MAWLAPGHQPLFLRSSRFRARDGLGGSRLARSRGRAAGISGPARCGQASSLEAPIVAGGHAGSAGRSGEATGCPAAASARRRCAAIWLPASACHIGTAVGLIRLRTGVKPNPWSSRLALICSMSLRYAAGLPAGRGRHPAAPRLHALGPFGLSRRLALAGRPAGRCQARPASSRRSLTRSRGNESSWAAAHPDGRHSVR